MLMESVTLTDGEGIGFTVSDYGDCLTLCVWNETQVEVLVEDQLPERARQLEVCVAGDSGWLVYLSESEPRANDTLVIQIDSGDLTVKRGTAAHHLYQTLCRRVIWQNLACGQRPPTPLTESAYQ